MILCGDDGIITKGSKLLGIDFWGIRRYVFTLTMHTIDSQIRTGQRQMSLAEQPGEKSPFSDPSSEDLPEQIRRVAENCSDCGLCRKSCRFLEKYGTPLHIARRYTPDDPVFLKMAFECSLCGLCTAVCPAGVDPPAMFLAMRREYVGRGYESVASGCVFLGYERRGTSRHLSYYALPEGCDTVFFPGCTLPGTRPAATLDLYRHLRETIPALGMVLDCCTKPSHDLGRETYFGTMFGDMKDFLVQSGIRRVIAACPNCHKIFSRYGTPLTVTTLYEILLTLPQNPVQPPRRPFVTVHDPCVFRFDRGIQAAVRELLARSGWEVREMPHHGERTLCCGQGASVGCVAPDHADAWKRLRLREAAGRPIVTYCSGCAGCLGDGGRSYHILDLIFGPGSNPQSGHPVALGRPVRFPGFPLTCFHRIRLKQRVKREIDAAVSRERTFHLPAPGSTAAAVTRNNLSFLISLMMAKTMGWKGGG